MSLQSSEQPDWSPYSEISKILVNQTPVRELMEHLVEIHLSRSASKLAHSRRLRPLPCWAIMKVWPLSPNSPSTTHSFAMSSSSLFLLIRSVSVLEIDIFHTAHLRKPFSETVSRILQCAKSCSSDWGNKLRWVVNTVEEVVLLNTTVHVIIALSNNFRNCID